MRIALILKGSLNALPPVLSLCHSLLDLGHELTLVCDHVTEIVKKDLEGRGVRVILLKQAPALPTKFGKIVRWYCFHQNAWNAIKQLLPDLFWIGSADTVLALGEGVFKLPYVLHIHELYDTVRMYRKRLGEYMRNAKKVFVPEEVRAHIFRAWYQLKETPVVLPNKPYWHPRTRNIPITDSKAAEAFAKIPQDAKILFYQGGVNASRNIKPFLDVIISLGQPWCLAVQCPECDYDFIRKNFCCSNVYHIPYLPAPQHLEITSHVHFGLVTYEHLHMNNEFCAPNKIWEYSGFGIPMIGNDVFGLQTIFEKYGCGISVNPNSDSRDEIKNKLLDLMNNYERFSDRARLFFDSCDLNEKIEKALKQS